MSEKLKLTKAQRAAGIDRVGEDLALVSGAGCGKTFVLAKRFTQLLLQGKSENPLADYVALTFTDKASLEMSQRVAKMLGDLLQQQPLQKQKLQDWIQQLPMARISTIHSFCASILRAWAVEAGVDPDFAVCDEEAVTTQLRQDAVEQALLNVVEEGGPHALSLLTELPFSRVCEQIDWLVCHRGALCLEEYFDPGKTLMTWREKLEIARRNGRQRLRQDEAIRAKLEAIASGSCSDPGDKLLVYRDEQVAAIREILSAGDFRSSLFARLDASPGNIGSAKAWGSKEQVKGLRDAARQLVQSVQEFALYAEELGELDSQAAAFLAAMAHLAAEAQKLYAQEKRRRGLMDFDDLLVRTAELLQRRDDVRDTVAKAIRQLLIDEAQDTDALQMAMLERLMLGKAGGRDFGGGRLFVVGDAKQSIYRFRGAQVEVFQDLCDRLGADRREDLDTSFRTHNEGVQFVNRLFGPLMGGRYDTLKAHRQERPPEPAVEILLAAGTEDGPVTCAEEAVRAQAIATAQRIAEMISNEERRVWDDKAKRWRPVRAGDIAILFSRMTVSAEYERQLAARDVPYYVVAGTGFFQQQEVFDVLNGLRAIENPLDDVALLGALRGSLFGLDDSALMHLAECCQPPYFLSIPKADLSGRLPGGHEAALSHALALLADLRARKDAMAMDELIQELLDATGYEAGLAGSPYGRRMLGNVRMLLDRARRLQAGGMGLAEFITQMDRQILAEQRSEQAAVAGEQEDVVRLMTMHKAKGLEFPVVFVPDLNAGHRLSDSDLLERRDWGLTYCLRCRDDDDETQKPLSYRLARRAEEADEGQEDIRQLYVAVTRHKDHLVLVGADWRGAAGGFRESGGYLAAIDGVLGVAHALQAGGNIVYGKDNEFAALVRSVAPAAAKSSRGKGPLGRQLLAQVKSGAELAAAIAKASPAEAILPLIGPLPVEIAQAELAVTALGDFARCPMLYRWRYELRVPPERKKMGSTPVFLDPATVGTLYHRCMQLLDFHQPQRPRDLLTRVLGEMELEAAGQLDGLDEELTKILAMMQGGAMWKRLACAKQLYRELDFVLAVGPASLRGQIDLLYEDAEGWHIVDYKSDRVEAKDAPAHARAYELQMLVYSLAAGKMAACGAAALVDASLYFLRPGVEHRMELSAEDAAAAQANVTEAIGRLTTCRRSGVFPLNRTRSCGYCGHRALCEALPGTEEDYPR